MKDLKTTSFHRPIKFNHLSVFNSDVCFKEPIICDVYISGSLEVAASGHIGANPTSPGGLIVSGSAGLAPGETNEPIEALSGINIGPGPIPSWDPTATNAPSASFFNTAVAVTSSGVWSFGGAGTLGPGDNPTITLNGYSGIIKLNDVTLGLLGSVRISLENTVITPGDIIFTTAQEGPYGTPVAPLGAMLTSVGKVAAGECSINIVNVGNNITNDVVEIGFFIIGQTPGGPYGPGPH